MRSDIVNRLFDATAEIMSATTLLFVFVDQTPARHTSSTISSATTGKQTEVLVETNSEMMMMMAAVFGQRREKASVSAVRWMSARWKALLPETRAFYCGKCLTSFEAAPEREHRGDAKVH